MRRLFIGSFFVFLGIAGPFLIRAWQVKNVPPFIPQPSSFTLDPPAQAITATLSQSEGNVEHLTREADEYGEATPGGAIHQGEAIATKRGSATITLENLGILTLKENSEISIVNLIPQSLMLRQPSGTITYETGPSPFSVRTLHILAEIMGTVIIDVDDPIAEITVIKGATKFALVDTENNTKIWSLSGGQMAQINDETRIVVLRSQ